MRSIKAGNQFPRDLQLQRDAANRARAPALEMPRGGLRRATIRRKGSASGGIEFQASETESWKPSSFGQKRSKWNLCAPAGRAAQSTTNGQWSDAAEERQCRRQCGWASSHPDVQRIDRISTYLAGCRHGRRAPDGLLHPSRRRVGERLSAECGGAVAVAGGGRRPRGSKIEKEQRV